MIFFCFFDLACPFVGEMPPSLAIIAADGKTLEVYKHVATESTIAELVCRRVLQFSTDSFDARFSAIKKACTAKLTHLYHVAPDDDDNVEFRAENYEFELPWEGEITQFLYEPTDEHNLNYMCYIEEEKVDPELKMPASTMCRFVVAPQERFRVHLASRTSSSTSVLVLAVGIVARRLLHIGVK